VLGTVSYMSPEQARGEAPLTPQSDQFSLGVVLYELAAGRRAFQRDSAAETMAAIIREDPESLPASVPAPLRWVVARLLSKDPVDRYDSTRDPSQWAHLAQWPQRRGRVACLGASRGGPPRPAHRARGPRPAVGPLPQCDVARQPRLRRYPGAPDHGVGLTALAAPVRGHRPTPTVNRMAWQREMLPGRT
jgi:hypothetical protein